MTWSGGTRSVDEKRCRRLVAERSGGLCELAIPGECSGRATSMHHRRKRSHGGMWAPSNVLAACGHGTAGCHGYVELHPQEANESGWWLFTGEDPEHTPALISWRGVRERFLLDDEGGLYWPVRVGR